MGSAALRRLTVFFATDLHGSERCFRKFLAAARVYEADALILGGDLIGKEVVPIRRRAGGWSEGWSAGAWVRLDGESAVTAFAATAADRGAYAVVTDDAISAGAGLEVALAGAAGARLAGWVATARDRLPAKTALVVIPGNDDPPFVDEILVSERILAADGKVVVIGGGYQVAGLGCSTATPWHTHREYTEDEIAVRLATTLAMADPIAPLILDVHVPPYGIGLDECPALDEHLRPQIGIGGVRTAAVGSIAVRDAVLRYRPVLGLFGHIHEARGVARLGGTLCGNPGSDFTHGRLLGLLVVLQGSVVVDWLLTEG